jgi:hypothetical protein
MKLTHHLGLGAEEFLEYTSITRRKTERAPHVTG